MSRRPEKMDLSVRIRDDAFVVIASRNEQEYPMIRTQKLSTAHYWINNYRRFEKALKSRKDFYVC